MAQPAKMPLVPQSITILGVRRVLCAPLTEGGPLTRPWGSGSHLPPWSHLCPQPLCEASPAQAARQLFNEGIQEGIVPFCGGAGGVLTWGGNGLMEVEKGP